MDRRILGALALAALLMATADGASAQTYPNWRGEWGAAVPRLPGQQLRFDPNKAFGRRSKRR